MRLHWFQHAPFEGLGALSDWAASRGCEVEATRMFAGDRIPDLSGVDLLVVMGGPMGACDERIYPWMAEEKKAIAGAIRQGKAVFGICLGAQLIAAVLGARVYRNPHKEIGWFSVERTTDAAAVFELFPRNLDVFHWHGDTFDLPKGAVHLARSRACEHQAYLYDGRVLGLQFHIEMRRPDIEEMLKEGAEELVPAPWIQGAEEIRRLSGFADRTNAMLFDILDRLTA